LVRSVSGQGDGFILRVDQHVAALGGECELAAV